MEKKYFAYVLKCSDGTYYSGYTTDIKKREDTHNKGKGAKYTRSRLPVSMVYFEQFSTKSEAMSREYHLKQLSHKEKEKIFFDYELTNGDNNNIINKH